MSRHLALGKIDLLKSKHTLLRIGVKTPAYKPKGSPSKSLEDVHRIGGWDAGVIWNGIPFETLVIPAKAGIQSVGRAFPMACGVDSPFRGNDCTWDRPCLANDSGTGAMNTFATHFAEGP